MPILVLLSYCYYYTRVRCTKRCIIWYLYIIIYIIYGRRSEERGEVTHVYRVTHYIIIIYDFNTSAAASASGAVRSIMSFGPFMMSSLFYERPTPEPRLD